MERKDFLKASCLMGFCSCAGLLQGAGLIQPKDKEQNIADEKLRFVQRRFSKLLQIINTEIGVEERNQLLEQMGMECAKESIPGFHEYKGNINGFLKYIQTDWVETAVYNEDKNEIKIVDKKKDNCFCPFVDKNLITKEFCNCSKGWQKYTYQYILDLPTEVTIDESVLRGSDHCSFTIKIVTESMY